MGCSHSSERSAALERHRGVRPLQRHPPPTIVATWRCSCGPTENAHVRSKERLPPRRIRDHQRRSNWPRGRSLVSLLDPAWRPATIDGALVPRWNVCNNPESKCFAHTTTTRARLSSTRAPRRDPRPRTRCVSCHRRSGLRIPNSRASTRVFGSMTYCDLSERTQHDERTTTTRTTRPTNPEPSVRPGGTPCPPLRGRSRNAGSHGVARS